MRLAPFALWVAGAKGFSSRGATASLSSSALRLSNQQGSAAFVPLRLRAPTVAAPRRNMAASASGDAMEKSMLKIALCQMPVSHDKKKNHETVRKYVEDACQSSPGVQMIVLPEIWNGPYATAAFPEYAEVLPDVGDDSAPGSPSAQILMDLAKKYGVYIVGGSISEKVSGGGSNEDAVIYNTCLTLDPSGTVLAKHRKAHLFDIDVPGGITFRESDTLTAGDSVTHFALPGVGNVGIGICYDIRFQEYAHALRHKHQCKIMVYPGAFNLTTGPAHWELLQRGRAVDNQCFIVTASPARTEEDPESKYPHYSAWGHSTVVSPWGEIVATIDETPGIVTAELDMDKVTEMRRGIPIGDQRRSDLY